MERSVPGLAILAAITMTFASCGSDDDEESSGGGSATIAQLAQPDALDPALSYTVNGWEPMWLVYTPLLTYAHEEGTAGSELIPGLAEDLPEVSADGKTYTFQLRDGLTYSDGTPVVASDFAHTIKRVINLESGGSPFYLGIVGAEDYLAGNDPEADIEGITTDDKTGEITVELVEPDATFSNVVAMNFAGLVPGDTEFKNLTESPPPGVGPYEITESVPNRQFVMEKVEGFADFGIEDIPTGHLEKITTLIEKNITTVAQDVLDNELDYMQPAPPGDLLGTIREQASDRFAEYPSLNTFYFFLNTQVPPFDDPKVREAVNIGIDKPALARLFGGTVTPGCSFLPPGMPGYDEALDTTDCPWGDPNAAPDVERARELIEAAGATGAKVDVWGVTINPPGRVTSAYAEQLGEIGLDAQPKLVDPGVYFQTVGNQKTAAQTGFDNWVADFPHPLNFYFLFDGATIQPTNNQNHSNVDDPFINEELARLQEVTDLEAVAGDWAALDHYLIEPPQSYLAAYGHQVITQFLSERIDFDAALLHPVNGNDYTSWRLR